MGIFNLWFNGQNQPGAGTVGASAEKFKIQSRGLFRAANFEL
jgi:hypothetical protein